MIIPAYNQAAYLPTAIDSLLKQTRIPDEIVVVNDGSTDETAAILDKYAHPVKAITQPNGGPSSARNTGLQHTRCDLIAFLDADDTLLPESIERRAKILETQPDVDVVYGDCNIVNPAGRHIARYTEINHFPRPSGWVFATIARNNLMPIHAFMFRRTCLEKTGYFDESLRMSEDYDFWLRMAANYTFAYLDEPLCAYRMHDAMSSRALREGFKRWELKVHERVFALTAFNSLPSKEQARIYSTHGSRHALLDEMREARHWYIKAIRFAPTAWRGYFFLLLTFLGPGNFRRVLDLRSRALKNIKVHGIE